MPASAWRSHPSRFCSLSCSSSTGGGQAPSRWTAFGLRCHVGWTSPPRSQVSADTTAEYVMGELLVSLGRPFLCHSTLALKMDVAQPTPHDYPAHWEVDAVLSDGGAVHIRPIRPGDAVADRAFFSKLSPQSVYRRFFTPKRELSDAEVEHFTTVDYDDRMAFVTVLRDEIIAVGRYDRLATTDRADVAFVVADEDQGRGVGSLLLEYLASYARDKGITASAADTLSENRRMLDVFRSSGFTRESLSTEQGVTRVTFDIEPTGTTMEAIHEREWRAGVRSIERLMRPRANAV